MVAARRISLHHAVLWSWAFWVKISPEVWPWSLTPPPVSSTAMTLPPTVLGVACTLTGAVADTDPDARAVPALPGEAALNSARVAMAAAPANISCATRICRRRVSAELITSRPSVVNGLVVMHHI